MQSVWKIRSAEMRSMENESVWKIRSVEMGSMENEECVENKECGK